MATGHSYPIYVLTRFLRNGQKLICPNLYFVKHCNAGTNTGRFRNYPFAGITHKGALCTFVALPTIKQLFFKERFFQLFPRFNNWFLKQFFWTCFVLRFWCCVQWYVKHIFSLSKFLANIFFLTAWFWRFFERRTRPRARSGL